MHWFDMVVAGPEIARVLAPGGILAGRPVERLGRPGRLGCRARAGQRERDHRPA
ncbi:hypothetical protein [Streptomyces sp900116325]